MREILLDSLRKVGQKHCKTTSQRAVISAPLACKKTRIDPGLVPVASPSEASPSEASPKPAKQSPELIWQKLKRVVMKCTGLQDRPEVVSKADIEANSEVLVDVLEAQRFVCEVFTAMDVPDGAASEMADALIAADYMGQRSMGIHRLPLVAADLLNGTIDPRKQPKVVKEKDALALVEGQNAPGPIVANYCIDLAMCKARKQGIGYVAARCSNPIGMTSWYACHALAHRMIGICMANGPPSLVPSGATEPLLGNNSMACAAGRTQEQFLMNLDMSAQPVDQLQLQDCIGSARQLPGSLALGLGRYFAKREAQPLRVQRLHPFAPEHKAFGLAAMIDILCGVMTGARYATHLQKKNSLVTADSQLSNLGQVYIAIDPKRFCVNFEERLADFCKLLRNAAPSDPQQPPWLPGDQELQHMKLVDDQGGLALTVSTYSILQKLSKRLRITPIRPNNTK